MRNPPAILLLVFCIGWGRRIVSIPCRSPLASRGGPALLIDSA
jgi:hypothetical protein